MWHSKCGALLFQALQKFSTEPARSRFRLGGLVLEGSVKHFANSTESEFVVTDLATEILVRYRGALPDLFREGHSVVAEGYLKGWQPEAGAGVVLAEGREVGESGAVAMELREDVQKRARGLDCFFAASEVLAKHDEVRIGGGRGGWSGAEQIGFGAQG